MTLKQKKNLYKKLLGMDRLSVSMFHVHFKEITEAINSLRKEIENEGNKTEVK